MLRFAWGMPGFLKTGQIGEGREAATAAYVEAHARRGDVDHVLATIDEFAYEKSMLMNVGDEKGAARRRRPSRGPRDLLFIDHDKSAYLFDLQSILDRGWLHTGSIVVADNVLVPGAPKYRAYMRQQQGTLWHTVEHKTHIEYQSLLPDLVLESD